MDTRTREKLMAWGFLSPALVILTVFGLFPIGYALYVSLHRWRIRREALVGLEHYVRALGEPIFLMWFAAGLILLGGIFRLRGRLRRPDAGLSSLAYLATLLSVILALGALVTGLGGMVETGDPRLYNGFKVTFFYAAGTIPVQLSLAMGLAYLLFKSLRAKGAFRVIFFLPYITPVIASAVVFRTIFSPHPSSLANRFWEFFGLQNQRWLYESRSVLALLLQAAGFDQYPAWVDTFLPSLALVSIILYNIWVYIGYDTVILLAGLSAIPRHYYEAAQIDGANAWQVFRHITLPLVSPTLFFLSMVAVIGTFKAFNHLYIMRTPGARDSVDVLSVVIFDQIFEFHNAGYASAMAFVLFVAILGLTLLQNRALGKRVFYGE
jgi:multiple sugar transport system permease protein